MFLPSRIRRTFRPLVFALAASLAGGSVLVIAAGRNDAKAPMVNVKLDTAGIQRAVGSDLSFAPIVRGVTPSVVKVVVRENSKNVEGPAQDDSMFRWFFGPDAPNPNGGDRRMYRQPPREGLGSGVIVSEDGYILTNNHVIDGADKVTVTLADGREVTAKVIGADEKTDIAVIKVDEKGLPAITFAGSEDVEVGDRVLAIGNPFGIGQTVTSGIVSGTGRASQALGLDYQDFIQTDAAINPGNSGGALVDVRGRLIGINTAIYSRSGGFQGIGFAIPADLARSVMNSLVQYGKVTRGFLGVMIQGLNPELAEEFKIKDHKGVIVSDVTPDGPAEKAGVWAEDVIVAFNGTTVENTDRFRLAVASTPPGTEVTLKVVRDGVEKNLSLTVGELPGDQKVAADEKVDKPDDVLHGVHVTDLRPQMRTEFEIPARVQGAMVIEVEPDSPSAEAGLAPGDVIMEIDGKAVKSAADAVAMTETSEDRKTLLRIWSRGGTHFIVVDESAR